MERKRDEGGKCKPDKKKKPQESKNDWQRNDHRCLFNNVISLNQNYH